MNIWSLILISFNIDTLSLRGIRSSVSYGSEPRTRTRTGSSGPRTHEGRRKAARQSWSKNACILRVRVMHALVFYISLVLSFDTTAQLFILSLILLSDPYLVLSCLTLPYLTLFHPFLSPLPLPSCTPGTWAPFRVWTTHDRRVKAS